MTQTRNFQPDPRVRLEDCHDEDTLSARQAAWIIGQTTQTVRNLIKAGELQAFHAGVGQTGPYRIPAGSLKKFIAKRIAEASA